MPSSAFIDIDPWRTSIYSVTFLVLALSIVVSTQKGSIQLNSVYRRFFLTNQLGNASPAADPAETTHIKPARRPITTDIDRERQLYHILQNPERHPDALRRAERYTAHRLSQALHFKHGIWQLPDTFDRHSLETFLANGHDNNVHKYEEYCQRRRQGAGRELFKADGSTGSRTDKEKDKAFAEWWLRQSTPVKFVDGAWLSRIMCVPVQNGVEREVRRGAWQVMSEELGDGAMEMNHIAIYADLVKTLPNPITNSGDEASFIAPDMDLDDPRVWRAATTQLALGICAAECELLPEVLGFNMAYEDLPLHLLLTTHELRELGLEDKYFTLHVSIDNASSGHAAMGREVVCRYLESLPEGTEREQGWKRVRAGYTLAEMLPTTPERDSITEKLVKILGEKAEKGAGGVHCRSTVKIGGKTIRDWLCPEDAVQGCPPESSTAAHFRAFLRALIDSRWVIPGDPQSSRLCKELEWGGRMFGAFSGRETQVLTTWVEGLITESDKPAFEDAVMPKYNAEVGITRANPPKERGIGKAELNKLYPNLLGVSCSTVNELMSTTSVPQSVVPSTMAAATRLLEMWPTIPAKCASDVGMSAVRVLRAIYGFEDVEGRCAGMDEVLEPFSQGLAFNAMHFRRDSGVEVETEKSAPGHASEVEKVLIGISRKPEEMCAITWGLTLFFSTKMWPYHTSEKEIVERVQKECVEIINKERERDGWWQDVCSGWSLAGHLCDSTFDMVQA
ncbi:hypothetical protein SAICODRAFT_24264 [Saitoella complicata NRRL Y-17804]|nr:uncharacterized protein SAICODRAFT_24264 [Saitoella complicata NRRL Y-17804]ODQ54482.1 hypothetical protein SAICODRAFT_24264 [Saitoella complicata NRRL Y-17804]